MPTTELSTPQMLPRAVESETALVVNGSSRAAIIYPSGDSAYRQLADTLASAIEATGSSRPELAEAGTLMPDRQTPLPDAYRRRPLILLGSINTNQAFVTLYANLLCATDAIYPGEAGYDLRTVVNPYGTGENMILAGGSTLAGVRRAVERLTEVIQAHGGPGELRIPFLLDVELGAALLREFEEWPETPLGAPLPSMVEGMAKAWGYYEPILRGVGAYGVMYALTGDRRYGEYARDCLRMLNQQMLDSYGDWHYRAERVLRALPWLMAGGLLSDADIQRTDSLLLGTALGTQDMWWRVSTGEPPLGHRHHCIGTYEFLLLARYLQRANPNGAAQAECARWIEECQTYLDALAEARGDDQDDETSLNVVSTVLRYALGEERYSIFESGNARLMAERGLAIHDNKGAGAGWGGYGEAQGGMVFSQQDATTAVGVCAFYYQDGRYKWILEHLPNLKSPMRYIFLDFVPPFLRQYATGNELIPQQPQGLTGIQVIAASPHQIRINNHPPEHIEPRGHSVNARETWLLATGVGRNLMSADRAIDKLVLRGGFTPTDSYLLIQGYQGGYRWQGHMQAANCIVRFMQAGHPFLVQNTGKATPYHKNGVFISDGYNDTLLPPFAEWVATDTFDPVGLSVTRLNDIYHSNWTRHIFWSRRDGEYFVVIDLVEFQADGPYSLTCTWRTPGYARLEGSTWQADQGHHRFTLRNADNVAMTSEEEQDQGGALPYVLRQFQGGEFVTGDQAAFQNLFYVRPRDAAVELNIHRLSPRALIVSRDGTAEAWCEVGPALQSDLINAQAASLWLTADEIALSGTTHFSLAAANLHLTSDRPLGLLIDFKRGMIELQVDGPGANGAQVTLTQGVQVEQLVIDGSVQVALTAVVTEQQSQIAAWLARQAFPVTLNPEAVPAATKAWSPAWTYQTPTRLPNRIRDLTVEASPPPVDGFALQLIDAVLPDRREARRQWPDKQTINITLSLSHGQEIDYLRFIGDSDREPTLRTFSPLPDTILVSSNGHEYRPEPEPGTYHYKRYRDMEDQMQTRTVRVGSSAQEFKIMAQPPADGGPLVLHEVEVYGCEPQVPAIRYLKAADLDGDGQTEIVVINDARELILLDMDGHERWRQMLNGEATHLSLHDLDGSGRLSICLGLLGGILQIVSAAGTVVRSVPLAEQFQQRTDAFFGWFNTIHELQVYAREADGRAVLAVGGYSVIVFLNADYEIVGHSWFDGPWVTNILVADAGRTPGHLWARCGWNHGIGHYGPGDGTRPSGVIQDFGGVLQAMFRPLLRLVPFVTGRSLTFEWLTPDRILAIADSGVGVLEDDEWRWKVEGGTPYSAYLVAHGSIFLGGADGFVSAFDAETGVRRGRLNVGAPVVGLARYHTGFLVATRRDLKTVNADWQITSVTPIRALRMIGLNGSGVLVECDNHALVKLVE